jgi:hypothetical protein
MNLLKLIGEIDKGEISKKEEWEELKNRILDFIKDTSRPLNADLWRMNQERFLGI